VHSDEPGYKALIMVYDHKYFTYEDSDYRITSIPLTDKDL
jgi:hypothetical protein